MNSINKSSLKVEGKMSTKGSDVAGTIIAVGIAVFMIMVGAAVLFK
ncbi:hypothetical protein [Rheinheimera baltica]|nr:hypothetical protein [Rheinheimera baltica]